MLEFHFHLTGRAEHDKVFINRFVILMDVVGGFLDRELIEGGVFNGKLVLLALLILLWLSTGHKQQAGDERYQESKLSLFSSDLTFNYIPGLHLHEKDKLVHKQESTHTKKTESEHVQKQVRKSVL